MSAIDTPSENNNTRIETATVSSTTHSSSSPSSTSASSSSSSSTRRNETNTKNPSPTGWYSLKNENPIGTWEDSSVAFQLFQGRSPDTFGHFGFLNTPHIGCYTEDDYTPFLPLVCLSVPSYLQNSAMDQLPPNVTEILRVCHRRGIIKDLNQSIDIYSIIHSPWQPTECFFLDCQRFDEANLLPHAWVFSVDNTYQLSQGHSQILVQLFVGIFEPEGIDTAHLQSNDGIPINRLSLRPTIAHHGRFSPNNNNFRILGVGKNGDKNIANKYPCFYSVIVDRELRRAVVTLHVLPIKDEAGDKLRDILKTVISFDQLCTRLYPILPTFIDRLIPMYQPLWGKLPSELRQTIYGNSDNSNDSSSSPNHTLSLSTVSSTSSTAIASSVASSSSSSSSNVTETNTNNVNNMVVVKEEGEVTPPPG